LPEEVLTAGRPVARARRTRPILDPAGRGAD